MFLPEIQRTIIHTNWLKDGWEGSVIDLIEDEEIPFNTRFELVIENNLISDRLMRLFAVWCGRNVLKYVNEEKIGFLLDRVEDYAYERIERYELVHVYLNTIRELAIADKSEQLRESEEAAYSTVLTNAQNAAKEAALHSRNVLANYSDHQQVHRKHVWKIRDLVLSHLTTGDVCFIVRNIRKRD